MAFSEKLNGYWEEGYHYYMEFRDDALTVRSYDRKIVLETEVSYDAAALERGERILIRLKDPVLSRTITREMMTEIGELAYEDGELRMLYHYPILGDKHYTLHKVDHDPFADIILRDEEYLDRLQGDWFEWIGTGKGADNSKRLTVKGNRLSWGVFGGGPFHVISYVSSPDIILLTPEDLTRSDFGGFTRIEVKPDMLITTMMVTDMSMPSTVFARKDMLDKIEVPGSALRAPINTMMYREPAAPIGFMGPMGSMNPLGSFGPMMGPANPAEPLQKPEPPKEGGTFCPACGEGLQEPLPRFCPECGTLLRK